MGKLYLTCGDFILNSKNMIAIVNAQNKYMQNGFKTGLISEFIQKKFKIKQNCKFKNFIDKINISKPYTIY